jgi:alanine dehydrogenase
MLLLNNDEVAQVLTIESTIDALELAYRSFADGLAVCRPRIDIRVPTSDPHRYYQWGTMEGGSTAGYFAIRMKSDLVYETEAEGARVEEKYAMRPGRYCGLVLLVDIETAEPVALLNDGYLQHLRVAGDGAIGAKVMARADARTVGMLGSGGMARDFARALKVVRPIERMVVFSPTKAHRERYAREMGEELGIPVIPVDDPRDAYRGADILASCTNSVVPVVRGAWLEPGMHVVSVSPEPEALPRFDLRLRFGTAPAPVGRPEFAVADTWLGYVAAPDAPVWNNIQRKGNRPAPVVTGAIEVSLADVLAGRAARTSAEQITFSDRGNLQGLQFFAVASIAFEAARKRGLGRELPVDWFLQNIRD